MFRLIDLIFPPRVDEVTLRETSLDDFLSLMRPVIVPNRDETVALLPFHDSRVRAALHEAKYHGSGRAFDHLGAVCAEYLCDMDAWGPRTITIVPVPLGKARQKRRGFNQVEEVARKALTHLPKDSRITLDASLLVRTRETATQVGLPREKREKNMRGAFGAARPLDPAPLYLVLDDVITTGATIAAACEALRAAGAQEILPLALAH